MESKQKENNTSKIIIGIYYILLFFIVGDKDIDSGTITVALKAGFMFIWSLLVGGVIALVAFPVLSIFYTPNQQEKDFVIHNLLYIIMVFGFATVLFVAYR